MNKRIVYCRLAPLVLSVFLASSMAKAEIEEVVVSIDGMACPFCAYGVEKKLGAVDGVKTVRIDTKKGVAILKAGKDRSIALINVPRAVKQAGFTPRELNVTATGTVEQDDQQRLFLMTAQGKRLFLLFDLKDTMKEQLMSAAGSTAWVRISGVVHFHEKALAALSPATVEELRE